MLAKWFLISYTPEDDDKKAEICNVIMNLILMLAFQLQWGFNFNYCPWLRGFQFIVTLNAFANALCTEDGSMCRIKGPQNAASPALNGQVLDSL